MKKYISFIAISAVLAYFVLFFDIDISHSRLLQEVWNAGHVLLFVFITAYFYKKWLNRFSLPLSLEIGLIIFMSFTLGLFIEYIQLFTGRDKSYYDVGLDVIGGLFGIIFYSKQLKQKSKILRTTMSLIVLPTSLVFMYPMFVNIIDDIKQTQEFPLIFSNNHIRELLRFEKNNINIEFVKDDFNSTDSINVFKIIFLPGKYSTTGLGTGIQDWSSFNYLVFSIYNPYSKIETISIRIDDSDHANSGYAYNDRFSRKLKVMPGWNKLTLALADIKRAPVGRQMNMRKIDQILLYKSNLKKPVVLYLNKMELIK